jgi:2-dehydro-3-deoxygalactonokinase
MMGMAAAFIGVDWGTSNARFMLVGADGALIEERAGPGIARLDGASAIESACFDALAGWPNVPVVMAGMVGSNIGWALAPYTKTPAKPTGANTVCFNALDRTFAILPGVETIRLDGFPDVMRGEETQIFGGIDGDSALVCLPGTHSKWAVVTDGAITDFHTAMTGELLDIIGRSSILLSPKRPPAAQPSDIFLDGVTAIKGSALGLETLLFTVRSRQIIGTLSTEAADGYLAGLCIGADIRSALMVYREARSVTLIGSPALTALYASALAAFGIPSRQIDGRDAALAGLTTAYREIFE